MTSSPGALSSPLRVSHSVVLRNATQQFPQPWYGVVEGMDLDGAPLAPGTGTNCGDNPNTMAHSFLYNIEADPSEQHDMWDERPDVVANLTARVFDLARHEAVSQWQPETTEASDACCCFYVPACPAGHVTFTVGSR